MLRPWHGLFRDMRRSIGGSSGLRRRSWRRRAHGLLHLSFTVRLTCCTLHLRYVSLTVHRLDCTRGVREIRTRQVESKQSANLIVAGTREGILRGDDFDIGGNAGLEPALRLSYLILSQGKTEVGDVDSVARRGEFVEGSLDLVDDARFQRPASFRHAVFFQFGYGLLRADAASGKQGKIEGDGVRVSGYAVIE